MKSKSKLKEIDIKNYVCYYFYDIINGAKINFSNILLNKKMSENILVYNISYKSPAGPKPLYIRFDKIYEFIIYLLIKFVIKLNILKVKKLVLQVVFVKI